MTKSLASLIVVLSTAVAVAADTPVPGRSPGLELAASRVAAAAAEQDPATARGLAAAALPELRQLTQETPTAPCPALLLLAEAELRAESASEARRTLERAQAAGCHPAIVSYLDAWSLEFGTDGARLGRDAPLEEAERAYVRAGLLVPSLAEGGTEIAAAAFGRAGAIAALLGSPERCAGRTERALPLALTAAHRQSLALQFLTCSAVDIGEGASIDRLQGLVPEGEYAQVAAARLSAIEARLKVDPNDPGALVAVAYHAFLARERPEQLVYARRYLLRAAAQDEGLPDLWYLFGRVNEEAGRAEEAKDNYRRQIREHAGSPAARLAANDLAYLCATTRSTPAELSAALQFVDAEIAATPTVAPLHDTRARVLLALGRRADALAAFDSSLALTPDPDVQAARDALAARP